MPEEAVGSEAVVALLAASVAELPDGEVDCADKADEAILGEMKRLRRGCAGDPEGELEIVNPSLSSPLESPEPNEARLAKRGLFYNHKIQLIMIIKKFVSTEVAFATNDSRNYKPSQFEHLKQRQIVKKMTHRTQNKQRQ